MKFLSFDFDFKLSNLLLYGFPKIILALDFIENDILIMKFIDRFDN